MVHASIHLLTLHTQKIYQPFPNKSFAYSCLQILSSCPSLKPDPPDPDPWYLPMRCKKREFQGPFLSNPVVWEIFFMGTWLFSFFQPPSPKGYNQVLPCFCFPSKKTSPCTFFPRGTGHTNDSCPAKPWIVDEISTTSKRNLPCFLHLVSTTTKTIQTTGPPVA